ncbi:DUF7260 family protein [Halohasta litorea]|uniref:DUF7260 domain-containing protein n=1 Tax=Halohasta litorea TaxID=869891 RepID=A0ABD6DBX0_9EURY|nr:hypothetical protein [Halohasta litorea]
MTDPEPVTELSLDAARRLVSDERDHVDEKLAAFDRFADGLCRLPTDSQSSGQPTTSPSSPTRSMPPSTGPPGSISAAVGGQSSNDDTTRRVRSLFAETVRPHSIEDVDEPEPLLVTIREELSPEIALAVASSTDRAFTPDLRAAICSAVDQSQAELRAMRQGLDTEADELRAADDLCGEITDCIDGDRQPCSELGFEVLSRRHELLASFRQQCETLAADRQSTLHGTTNHTATASLSHSTLVEYLYQPLTVGYPVLSAIAHLTDYCETCQRTVRRHLTRRG